MKNKDFVSIALCTLDNNENIMHSEKLPFKWAGTNALFENAEQEELDVPLEIAKLITKLISEHITMEKLITQLIIQHYNKETNSLDK